MDMKKDRNPNSPHVLLLAYPSQGHVNPMLQFSKKLVSKGVKATLLITDFISKSMNIPPKSNINCVQIDTISDGFDQSGFMEASSVTSYLAKLQVVGTQTLTELIRNYKTSKIIIDCVVYDAFMPWAVDVCKQFGLTSASFFTQPCGVNFIYYYVHHGLLKVPILSVPVLIPGLPLLQLEDMPSFIYVHGSYPSYFELVLNQFLNADKADFVLVNSFYELEDEVVDAMSKQAGPVLTIGPTVPSIYLDNSIENDDVYGLNLFHVDDNASQACLQWLSTKPEGSVVYVSFGSMANLCEEQMEELALGLLESNHFFLWVVRESEERKLLNKVKQELCSSKKGLLVQWCSQLQTLSSISMGCFFSHCGWNSTIEAICLGVPMVVMPQWTDQTTNAKFVQDVWKVGIRVKVGENGIVGREEIKGCIREVMEEEKGKELKQNAIKWRNIAKEAISKGGSSDKNIDHFISKLKNSSCHFN